MTGRIYSSLSILTVVERVKIKIALRKTDLHDTSELQLYMWVLSGELAMTETHKQTPPTRFMLWPGLVGANSLLMTQYRTLHIV